jgi:hypothetical protein
MMSKGDLPLLAAVLAGAALLTVLTFLVARMVTGNSRVLRAVSGLAAPSFIAALAFGIEIWNPDPHGWVLTSLLLLAAICLPVTLLTSDLLVRQITKRDYDDGQPGPPSNRKRKVPQAVWWTLGCAGTAALLFFVIVLLGQLLFAFNPNH